MPKITIKLLGMEVSAQGVLSDARASITALAALTVIWANLNKQDIPPSNHIVNLTQLVI